MIEKILEKFKNDERVEAIALGGSRAGENFDEKSDYDIYVYYNEMIPEKERKEIYLDVCSKIEIGNHYWEYEDNGVLNDGVEFDVVYRKLDDFINGISYVVDKCNSHNGYTTCMWHNLINCKILFDKNKKLEKYQKQYSIDYPKKLKENIILRNMNLLSDALPAYKGQIKKATGRADVVSINHRITEFLASYFDIIFALNELTHPGEKRLVEISLKKCKKLPKNFSQNIENLLKNIAVNNENINLYIQEIVRELKEILK